MSDGARKSSAYVVACCFVSLRGGGGGGGGGDGVYTVSEWFKPLEPPRIFSNHFSAEKARCVEVFDVSSEWFDCTEPSRTSSTQW